MKIDNKKEVIDYINKLQGYQGYVQFSHRAIDSKKDIFNDETVQVEDESGFIYEAHFCNDKQSISIRQINDSWLISITDITGLNDTQEYLTDISDFNYKVQMAQIWIAEDDPLCKNMKVKKLKKVVFAGFING